MQGMTACLLLVPLRHVSTHYGALCYAQCVYLQIHMMLLPAATAAARVAAALCVQVMNSRSLPEGIDGDRACKNCLNFECNWCSINRSHVYGKLSSALSCSSHAGTSIEQQYRCRHWLIQECAVCMQGRSCCGASLLLR